MAIRQYIGARYVPRFMGTYNPLQLYEVLDVVDNGMGTSYILKKPAPTGTPVTDSNYWAIYGATSGAIINLQNQIDDNRADIEDLQEEKLDENSIQKTPINKWYPDNEKVNDSPYLINSLTFKKVFNGCFAFRDNILVSEWRPGPDKAKEDALHTVIAAGNNDYYYRKTGIHFNVSDGVTQSTQFGDILKIERDQCLTCKIDGHKGDTTYNRTGVTFGGMLSVYYNNAAKKIYYESIENSYAPTDLNSDMSNYDCEEIQLYCFIKGDNSVSVYAAIDEKAPIYIGSTPAMTHDIIATGAGIFVRQQDVNYGGLTCDIWDYKVIYTALTFADCKYIHYDDTTPYIQDGKAYIIANMQAEGIAITAILRHTLGFADFEMVGIIKSNEAPNALGVDMCFDRKNKRFITFFRQSDRDPIGISYAISHNNNFNGILKFDSVILDTVPNHDEFGNYQLDEDPVICFYDGHWYVAINRCEIEAYYYDVFRTRGDVFDIDDFEFVNTLSASSLTGGSFMILNDALYLVCGNSTYISVFDVINGTYLGNLSITIANRVWGNITCINRANKTVFYLTTFDRVKYTSGGWSYGNMQVLVAENDIPELVTSNTYTL